MYTKTLIAASMVAGALAAPVAAPQPQLLNDISPDVAALLTGLGLPNVGVPLSGILSDAGDNVKRQDAGAVPELLSSLAGEGGSVPELLTSTLGEGGSVADLLAQLTGTPAKRQLLNDISPDVAALLAGLGLPNVGLPVAGILSDAGDNVKRQEAGAVPDLLSSLLSEGGSVPELLTSLLGSASVPAVPAKRQLLNDISPDVAALLAGLGLPTVGVPVSGIVSSVGDNVKRQDAGSIPELLTSLLGEGGDVPQLLTGLLGSRSPVAKRQLLNDISPDVAALLAGLGLPTVGAPVAGILESAGSDVKRQLLNDISPDVVALLSGLGLPNVAVPVGGILDSAGSDVKRQLLNDISPDVAALLAGLGLPTVGAPVAGILTDAGDNV